MSGKFALLIIVVVYSFCTGCAVSPMAREEGLTLF